MDLEKFKKLPIMGILRGVLSSEIEPLIAAVIEAGLETIEITMNTKDAAELIRRAVTVSKGRMVIGAGTVLNMHSLKFALDAGASFIVMPTLVTEVSQYCLKKRIPFFPGALTPQEIYKAWSEGATMVKVFPAKFFGPEYFKEIKGPFNEIKLLACGGVTPENMKAYFSNGAEAVTFGSSVFRKEWLVKQDYIKIRRLVKRYLEEFLSIEKEKVKETA